MNTLIISIIAFFVSYLSLQILKKIAFRFNILDLPGGRKVHKNATALLGGAGIYLGLLCGVMFILKDMAIFFPVFIAATLILILGLIEDIRKLSAKQRLFCQLAISLALILLSPEVRVSFMPANTFGEIIEIIVTLLWIVGVTNAYNYLDGLDGLAAGSVIINLFCFSVILYATTQHLIVVICLILIAACLGFLPHNFSKNKIFLGEAGSTFLGYMLACIALIGNWAEDSMVKLFIPILILGVPIFDMIFTTIMRIRDGKVRTLIRWLTYGGKDHFHHYLVDIGLSPRGAVIFIYSITLSLGISAIMVSNDKAFEGFLSLFQAAIIAGIIATLIVAGKHRRSGWNK
ncbi:MAG: undecaprenyl/decaprenyl-phosphate alpha-N-acetylglucosaminyl 1-phosphate transferase [Candidatus Omnitrophica bacterium]|nr:undecaprenyl/decaprenyl-phosphate alpha-N-acetylglucosaminyl 1-phosphate transferase [Candidatus Omnitrophota bacterium]MBU1928499.1 undecaprenyl/decaprenyl-phosphate alpha-N-acetylglucosaminyl 1-phosphate transferase [Candidatus Omnitrophota bacterium]